MRNDVAEHIEEIVEHEHVVGVLVEDVVDDVLDDQLLLQVLVLLQNVVTDLGQVQPVHLHVSAFGASVLVAGFLKKVIQFPLEYERLEIDVGVLDFCLAVDCQVHIFLHHNFKYLVLIVFTRVIESLLEEFKI